MIKVPRVHFHDFSCNSGQHKSNKICLFRETYNICMGPKQGPWDVNKVPRDLLRSHEKQCIMGPKGPIGPYYLTYIPF